jgi:hypothetical protein
MIGWCCRIYKVFDLKNYTMLYSISDENVQEIKIRLVLQYDVIWSRCVQLALRVVKV